MTEFLPDVQEKLMNKIQVAALNSMLRMNIFNQEDNPDTSLYVTDEEIISILSRNTSIEFDRWVMKQALAPEYMTRLVNRYRMLKERNEKGEVLYSFTRPEATDEFSKDLISKIHTLVHFYFESGDVIDINHVLSMVGISADSERYVTALLVGKPAILSTHLVQINANFNIVKN